MLICTHVAPNQVAERWFRRSTIEYADYYIRLYIAFNAWYQVAAHTLNDRQALHYIKQRSELWEAYLQGARLGPLRQYMVLLVEATQREPVFRHSYHWSGSLHNVRDWPGLVEFWYLVRCHIVHGGEVSAQHLQLAYQTLYIFMNEVLWGASRKHTSTSLLFSNNTV